MEHVAPDESGTSSHDISIIPPSVPSAHSGAAPGDGEIAQEFQSSEFLLCALSMLGEPYMRQCREGTWQLLKGVTAEDATGNRTASAHDSECSEGSRKAAHVPPEAVTRRPSVAKVAHLPWQAALHVVETMHGHQLQEQQGSTALPWCGHLGPLFIPSRGCPMRPSQDSYPTSTMEFAIDHLVRQPCPTWALPMVYQDHQWLEDIPPLSLSRSSTFAKQHRASPASMAAWGRHLVDSGYVDSALLLCTATSDLQIMLPIVLQVLSAPPCACPKAAAAVQNVVRFCEPPLHVESPKWSTQARHLTDAQEKVQSLACTECGLYILTCRRIVAYNKCTFEQLCSEDVVGGPAAIAVACGRLFFHTPQALRGPVLVELDPKTLQQVSQAPPNHPLQSADSLRTTILATQSALYALTRVKEGYSVWQCSLEAGTGYRVLRRVTLTMSASPAFQPDRLKALRTHSEHPLHADVEVQDLLGFTIEVWARVDAMELMSHYHYIWRLVDGGKEVKLGFGDNGLQLVSSLLGMEVCVSCPFLHSTWCHYAATVDERGRWTLWCNGKMQGCTSSEPAYRMQGPLPFSAKSLHIGCFEGCMLELRLWSEARLPFDLVSNWQRTVRPSHPCLLAYWTLCKEFGNWVIDRKAHVPPREVPERSQSQWVRCDSPLDYLADEITPGDALNAAHLLDDILSDFSEVRVCTVGEQLRLQKQSPGKSDIGAKFSLATGRMLGMTVRRGAVERRISCMDPSLEGYWAYVASASTVSFVPLPESMLVRLKGMSRLSKLLDSLDDPQQRPVQSQLCSWALLSFAALLSDCHKSEGSTLYRHWFVDVTPETLCMLAQTLFDAISKGSGVCHCARPSSGFSERTNLYSLPPSLESESHRFITAILKLFAVNISQINTSREVFHTYRFQNVDTPKLLIALTTFLTVHSGSSSDDSVEAAFNASKVVQLLVQISLTVPEKVDAMLCALLNSTAAITAGDSLLLRACLDHLSSSHRASQTVRYLATKSHDEVANALERLLELCLSSPLPSSSARYSPPAREAPCPSPSQDPDPSTPPYTTAEPPSWSSLTSTPPAHTSVPASRHNPPSLVTCSQSFLLGLHMALCNEGLSLMQNQDAEGQLATFFEIMVDKVCDYIPSTGGGPDLPVLWALMNSWVSALGQSTLDYLRRVMPCLQRLLLRVSQYTKATQRQVPCVPTLHRWARSLESAHPHTASQEWHVVVPGAKKLSVSFNRCTSLGDSVLTFFMPSSDLDPIRKDGATPLSDLELPTDNVIVYLSGGTQEAWGMACTVYAEVPAVAPVVHAALELQLGLLRLLAEYAGRLISSAPVPALPGTKPLPDTSPLRGGTSEALLSACDGAPPALSPLKNLLLGQDSAEADTAHWQGIMRMLQLPAGHTVSPRVRQVLCAVYAALAYHSGLEVVGPAAWSEAEQALCVLVAKLWPSVQGLYQEERDRGRRFLEHVLKRAQLLACGIGARLLIPSAQGAQSSVTSALDAARDMEVDAPSTDHARSAQCTSAMLIGFVMDDTVDADAACNLLVASHRVAEARAEGYRLGTALLQHTDVAFITAGPAPDRPRLDMKDFMLRAVLGCNSPRHYLADLPCVGAEARAQLRAQAHAFYRTLVMCARAAPALPTTRLLLLLLLRVAWGVEDLCMLVSSGVLQDLADWVCPTGAPLRGELPAACLQAPQEAWNVLTTASISVTVEADACRARCDMETKSGCAVYGVASCSTTAFHPGAVAGYFEVSVQAFACKRSPWIGFVQTGDAATASSEVGAKCMVHNDADGELLQVVCSTEGARTFGPPLAPGETVGCGLLPATGQVFFTRNGHFIGRGGRAGGLVGDLVPCVLLLSVGTAVHANFGQRAFLFNVETLAADGALLWYLEPPAEQLATSASETLQYLLLSTIPKLLNAHSSPPAAAFVSALARTVCDRARQWLHTVPPVACTQHPILTHVTGLLVPGPHLLHVLPHIPALIPPLLTLTFQHSCTAALRQRALHLLSLILPLVSRDGQVPTAEALLGTLAPLIAAGLPFAPNAQTADGLAATQLAFGAITVTRALLRVPAWRADLLAALRAQLQAVAEPGPVMTILALRWPQHSLSPQWVHALVGLAVLGGHADILQVGAACSYGEQRYQVEAYHPALPTCHVLTEDGTVLELPEAGVVVAAAELCPLDDETAAVLFDLLELCGRTLLGHRQGAEGTHPGGGDVAKDQYDDSVDGGEILRHIVTRILRIFCENADLQGARLLPALQSLVCTATYRPFFTLTDTAVLEERLVLLHALLHTGGAGPPRQQCHPGIAAKWMQDSGDEDHKCHRSRPPGAEYWKEGMEALIPPAEVLENQPQGFSDAMMDYCGQIGTLTSVSPDRGGTARVQFGDGDWYWYDANRLLIPPSKRHAPWPPDSAEVSDSDPDLEDIETARRLGQAPPGLLRFCPIENDGQVRCVVQRGRTVRWLQRTAYRTFVTDRAVDLQSTSVFEVQVQRMEHLSARFYMGLLPTDVLEVDDLNVKTFAELVVESKAQLWVSFVPLQTFCMGDVLTVRVLPDTIIFARNGRVHRTDSTAGITGSYVHAVSFVPREDALVPCDRWCTQVSITPAIHIEGMPQSGALDLEDTCPTFDLSRCHSAISVTDKNAALDANGPLVACIDVPKRCRCFTFENRGRNSSFEFGLHDRSNCNLEDSLDFEIVGGTPGMYKASIKGDLVTIDCPNSQQYSTTVSTAGKQFAFCLYRGTAVLLDVPCSRLKPGDDEHDNDNDNDDDDIEEEARACVSPSQSPVKGGVPRSDSSPCPMADSSKAEDALRTDPRAVSPETIGSLPREVPSPGREAGPRRPPVLGLWSDRDLLPPMEHDESDKGPVCAEQQKEEDALVFGLATAPAAHRGHSRFKFINDGLQMATHDGPYTAKLLVVAGTITRTLLTVYTQRLFVACLRRAPGPMLQACHPDLVAAVLVRTVKTPATLTGPLGLDTLLTDLLLHCQHDTLCLTLLRSCIALLGGRPAGYKLLQGTGEAAPDLWPQYLSLRCTSARGYTVDVVQVPPSGLDFYRDMRRPEPRADKPQPAPPVTPAPRDESPAVHKPYALHVSPADPNVAKGTPLDDSSGDEDPDAIWLFQTVPPRHQQKRRRGNSEKPTPMAITSATLGTACDPGSGAPGNRPPNDKAGSIATAVSTGPWHVACSPGSKAPAVSPNTDEAPLDAVVTMPQSRKRPRSEAAEEEALHTPTAVAATASRSPEDAIQRVLTVVVPGRYYVRGAAVWMCAPRAGYCVHVLPDEALVRSSAVRNTLIATGLRLLRLQLCCGIPSVPPPLWGCLLRAVVAAVHRTVGAHRRSALRLLAQLLRLAPRLSAVVSASSPCSGAPRPLVPPPFSGAGASAATGATTATAAADLDWGVLAHCYDLLGRQLQERSPHRHCVVDVFRALAETTLLHPRTATATSALQGLAVESRCPNPTALGFNRRQAHSSVRICATTLTGRAEGPAIVYLDLGPGCTHFGFEVKGAAARWQFGMHAAPAELERELSHKMVGEDAGLGPAEWTVTLTEENGVRVHGSGGKLVHESGPLPLRAATHLAFCVWKDTSVTVSGRTSLPAQLYPLVLLENVAASLRPDGVPHRGALAGLLMTPAPAVPLHFGVPVPQEQRRFEGPCFLSVLSRGRWYYELQMVPAMDDETKAQQHLGCCTLDSKGVLLKLLCNGAGMSVQESPTPEAPAPVSPLPAAFNPFGPLMVPLIQTNTVSSLPCLLLPRSSSRTTIPQLGISTTSLGPTHPVLPLASHAEEPRPNPETPVFYDTIGCMISCEDGSVTFTCNGQLLGWGFTGLDLQTHGVIPFVKISACTAVFDWASLKFKPPGFEPMPHTSLVSQMQEAYANLSESLTADVLAAGCFSETRESAAAHLCAATHAPKSPLTPSRPPRWPVPSGSEQPALPRGSKAESSGSPPVAVPALFLTSAACADPSSASHSSVTDAGARASEGRTCGAPTTTQGRRSPQPSLTLWLQMAQFLNTKYTKTDIATLALQSDFMYQTIKTYPALLGAWRDGGDLHAVMGQVYAVQQLLYHVMPYISGPVYSLGPLSVAYTTLKEMISTRKQCELLLKEGHTKKHHQPTIRLNRLKAAFARDKSPQPPGAWAHSQFAQLHAQLSHYEPRSIFATKEPFWKVDSIGFAAQDCGGPFRQSVVEISHELMSDYCPLFTPTPNARRMSAPGLSYRTLAAGPPSAEQAAQLVLVGQLIGGCLFSDENLLLDLPPLLWKQFVGTEVLPQDWECVDTEFYHSLCTPPQEDPDTSSPYNTPSDGPGSQTLDPGPTAEAAAMLQGRLQESEAQLRAVRKGLLSVVPPSVLLLLNWQDMERMVCGEARISVADLKKSISFRPSRPRAEEFFWEALQRMSHADRSLLCQFATGRPRLPVQFTICWADDVARLPQATTCSMEVSLPAYSSSQTMYDKLMLAFHHCLDIDTDGQYVGDVDVGAGPDVPQMDVAENANQACVIQ